MRILISVALILIMGPAAAHAAWMHSKDEDPFRGDAHLAMGFDLETGYGAGFRCVVGKEAELTFIFATPEKMPQESLAALSAMPVKLLIIVDDQPKVEMEGTADAVGDLNLLRIQSTDTGVASLVKAAMVAKRRFAVAAEAMGKIVHSHTFDLRGSKRAIGEMATACKLP
jgi:hypothetical protein